MSNAVEEAGKFSDTLVGDILFHDGSALDMCEDRARGALEVCSKRRDMRFPCVRSMLESRKNDAFLRWTHAMPLQESVAMMVPRCSARQLGRGKLRRTRSALAFLRNQPRGALRCMRVRRKRRGRMPFALGNGV